MKPDCGYVAATKPALFILRRNSGQSGGAERVAERFAGSFAERYAVSRVWAGTTLDGARVPGRGGPPWWRSFRYTRQVDRAGLRQRGLVLSLEYGPDCHVYRAGDGIHRQNIRRRYGRDPRWLVNPWHWYAPLLERKCMGSARAIVANSHLVKAAIAAEYPDFASKVSVIHNGFDGGVFHLGVEGREAIRERLALPPSASVLLLSGSGFVRKGLTFAIQLLAHVLQEARVPEPLLVVCGRGDAAPHRALAERLGVEDRLLIRGNVPDIADYYRAADAMVLATRFDPFSNATLEALACGCPVITTDANGAGEVVIPGRTGLVLPYAATTCSGSGEPPTETLRAVAAFLESRADRAAVANSVASREQAFEIAAYLELFASLGFPGSNGASIQP